MRDDEMQKIWEKPKLVVLTRKKSAENILEVCKYGTPGGYIGDAEANNFDACANFDGECQPTCAGQSGS